MLRKFRSILLVTALAGAAGCAAPSGRVAPIEDGRRVESVDATVRRELPRAPPPRAESAAKPVASDARVYALPDAAAPAPAPMPDPARFDGAQALPAAPPDPVTAELLAQAERALARGDRGAARATLERAINLRPRDSLAWTELAELNHAEGEYRQALVVAHRARNLAGKDPAQLTRIDLLLARARARLARQGTSE